MTMYEFEKNTIELEIWRLLYKTKSGLSGAALRQKLDKMQVFSEEKYQAALRSLKEEHVIRYHMKKWTLRE